MNISMECATIKERLKMEIIDKMSILFDINVVS